MEPADPRHPGLALSRRRFVAGGTVLGAGLAWGAGGCALNDPFSATPTPTRRSGGLAPDVTVATQAVRAIDAASVVVVRAADRPGLATRLEPLRAMHDAHRAALVDAVPAHTRAAMSAATGAPTSTPATPAGEATGLARVRAAEAALHDTLIALALRAESGLFARLLGSMAASVSQHLTELAR